MARTPWQDEDSEKTFQETDTQGKASFNERFSGDTSKADPPSPSVNATANRPMGPSVGTRIVPEVDTEVQDMRHGMDTLGADKQLRGRWWPAPGTGSGRYGPKSKRI